MSIVDTVFRVTAWAIGFVYTYEYLNKYLNRRAFLSLVSKPSSRPSSCDNCNSIDLPWHKLFSSNLMMALLYTNGEHLDFSSDWEFYKFCEYIFERTDFLNFISSSYQLSKRKCVWYEATKFFDTDEDGHNIFYYIDNCSRLDRHQKYFLKSTIVRKYKEDRYNWDIEGYRTWRKQAKHMSW